MNTPSRLSDRPLCLWPVATCKRPPPGGMVYHASPFLSIYTPRLPRWLTLRYSNTIRRRSRGTAPMIGRSIAKRRYLSTLKRAAPRLNVRNFAQSFRSDRSVEQLAGIDFAAYS